MVTGVLQKIVTFFRAERVTVTGSSMEPGYADGDRLVVDSRQYGSGGPSRFDVVLIRASAQRQDLKRVVGLPGERVSLDSRGLMIDGVVMDEPHVADSGQTTLAEHHWEAAEGEYVVLGDNRAPSTDSRDYGLVKRSQIIGPVMRRF